ncbi:MAG: epimerase [Bacteroidetes bacterium]|nr:epimerase [Bacteroidota bacterium]
MKKVSILGLGWLGQTAGLLLLQQGYQVLGSATSLEKAAQLQEKGIDVVQLKLNPYPEGRDYLRLFESQVLVVTLPPRSRHGESEVYLQQLAVIRELLTASAVEQVIFISSTGIYPNVSKVDSYTEAERISESKAGNTILYRAEQLMATTPSYVLTILRMGGLMGDNRIPGLYFSGKEQVVGHTRVNFIHQLDAARMIAWVIDQGLWNQTFNGVAPQHPFRREVYAKNASTLGILPPVSYQETADEKKGRWISSEKISATGFSFDFPNPLDFTYATRL